MLWPIVLPVKITFYTLSGLLLVATTVAPLFRQERKVVFAWGALLGVLAFIPSCAGVMSVLDHYRFGVCTYPDSQSVNDSHVQHWLPEMATDITVDQSPAGFRARFRIEKPALDKWFDRFWQQYGEHSAIPRAPREESKPIHPDELEFYFGDLGWPPPSDAVAYEGPRTANGAGFTLWYSESQGVAYQDAGYW